VSSIKVKAVGASSVRVGTVGEALGRSELRVPASRWQPLCTGSLALDLISGTGGIRRGSMACIVGPSLTVRQRLLHGMIGESQARSCNVAVIDIGRVLSRQAANRSVIDFDRLLLVRADEPSDALSSATELLDSDAVDLLVINEPGETLDRHLSGLSPREQRAAWSRLRRSIETLASRTAASSTAVLVSTDEPDRLWRPHAALEMRVEPSTIAASTPAGIVTTVDVGGDETHHPRLELQRDGSVEPFVDLVESALQWQRVEPILPPAGASMHPPPAPSDRAQITSELRQDVDASLELRGLLERRAQELRSTAAPAPVPEGSSRSVVFGSPGTVGRPLPPRPSRTERSVNTWFEGDEPVLPLVVGFGVLLSINVGPTRDGGMSMPFTEPNRDATHDIDILVTVYGSAFAVQPRSRQLVLPPMPAASEPVAFAITPRQPGEHVLRIILSTHRELELLQELELDLTVVEERALEEVAL
jgi:hypothetical protein